MLEYFNDLRVDVQVDAGHFVHREQPDIAAEAIAAFFERLSRA
jgi:pimeloyl-ACP methyl ester carboxylesterase